ncbi:putative quinol monooxygenase [Geodermatophilus sp. FMUSA9-8]|uniref:putative quinol monooxygenase n=1 Tax=Geodermatophilus sp. FMUSA9-8 TaxID=3120155 RepID=UPI00300B4911
MAYAVVCRVSAKPGRREDLVEHMLRVAAALEDRSENLSCLVATADDDADAVWTWELWATREAHDAYLAEASTDPATYGLAVSGRELIAGMSPVQPLTVRGGGGLSG